MKKQPQIKYCSPRMLNCKSALVKPKEEVEIKQENYEVDDSQTNKIEIDENLKNIYNTICLKGSIGEVSLGSILTKTQNINYFIDYESYLNSGSKNLSESNIVVLSKNCDNSELSKIPQYVYIDVNNSLKEMMEIDKNTEFTI